MAKMAKTQENVRIKVMVSLVEPKDKSKPSFFKYKMVHPTTQRLVDLRFTKECNMSEINKCQKCWVDVEKLNDASANYEFPRFYASGIMAVEQII